MYTLHCVRERWAVHLHLTEREREVHVQLVQRVRERDRYTHSWFKGGEGGVQTQLVQEEEGPHTFVNADFRYSDKTNDSPDELFDIIHGQNLF